jgi:glycosyltransferase involved in cell wall biosynthesis
VPIAVVVPTFSRPEHLLRCLRALERQTVEPAEVIVAGRDHDDATRAAVAELAGDRIRYLTVRFGAPQLAAMNAGVEAADAQIVAFTDDDAEPRPDWLARLEAHFADPAVGAVGGPDLVHLSGGVLEGSESRVGVVTWYGRTVGNHHLGVGAARPVDFLKGVNLSVRRALWDVDPRLQGEGIQMHWEMDLCLGIRRRGHRVVYDPAIVVDHHPAPRATTADTRWPRTARAVWSEAHNETLVLLNRTTGIRRLLALPYALLVGTAAAPGVLRATAKLARGHAEAFGVLATTIRGRAAALRTLRQPGRPA